MDEEGRGEGKTDGALMLPVMADSDDSSGAGRAAAGHLTATPAAADDASRSASE